jgi:hypothetical protein
MSEVLSFRTLAPREWGDGLVVRQMHKLSGDEETDPMSPENENPNPHQQHDGRGSHQRHSQPKADAVHGASLESILNEVGRKKPGSDPGAEKYRDPKPIHCRGTLKG